jgi:hypothetical protein
MAGLGGWIPGRSLGIRTRSAFGRMAQRTGVAIMTVGPAAEPGDVARLVRVVADQQGLRVGDGDRAGAGGQLRAAVAGRDVGQHISVAFAMA